MTRKELPEGPVPVPAGTPTIEAIPTLEIHARAACPPADRLMVAFVEEFYRFGVDPHEVADLSPVQS